MFCVKKNRAIWITVWEKNTQFSFEYLKAKGGNEGGMHGENYPFVIQVLQRLFPGDLPNLHLSRLRDVGLPVDDSVVTPATARWESIKVKRLAVRGAFHRAEDATEFLPRPGWAVGAHALEESWHFPGGRHALQTSGCATLQQRCFKSQLLVNFFPFICHPLFLAQRLHALHSYCL